MEVRFLGPDDAEELVKIRLEGLQTDPDAFGSTYEEAMQVSMEEWRQRLSQGDSGDSGYFGAFVEGHLAGIIGFFRHRGVKARHKASIVSMYVREAYRGTGVAQALMQAELAYLKERGDIDTVQLAVVTTNPAAIRLYEKMGFIPYGLEKRALKNGDQYFDESHMYILL
ncbi:GNAT family N-acetyltransferase [Brevibacillus brevis]|uniref:GNAT family N-acetyltransferase n=1 Tax=Brevibacillus brevis TaxID=1393 RepID=UPI000D0F414E|nr:GNAT family N-acetyltransferase [Brevibacillus brevis]PSJ70817.1 GNAT family N-acetyltransferase [Brevibacillus brevis]RED31167.1 ribosomal protein S18 acetylase RimI-like enzyme [Brevibacillus brevis]VEF89619.1 Putative phosphinothricin acetyltransferase YwnH [Brevibacillus brevis]